MTDLVVDALATFRVTRLVTSDSITAPLRARVPAETLAGELVRCPWCVGWWSAVLIPLLPRWLRRSLALAAVAGILSEQYGD